MERENWPRLFQISELESPQDLNGIDARVLLSGVDVSGLVFDMKHTTEREWVYIPFNFRQKNRCQELKKALRYELGKDYDPEKLLSLLHNDYSDIAKIKAAYKRVTGSFNTNSMTLFSGICNSSVTQRLLTDITYNQAGFPCCYMRWATNGCLYTGDYDASGTEKWKELYDAYHQYFDYIGCVQIPHHGSRHNYNSELTNMRACTFYIISAGYKNKYRHPHSSVLKDLWINNIYPLIVNEYVGSGIHLKINY